jgi:hypothetical protein
MFLDEKKHGEAKTRETFLPASTLGIEASERDALIKSLDVLESGTIAARPPHAKYVGLTSVGYTPRLFDMSLVVWDSDCGTACCILGLARWVMKDQNILNGAVYPDHSANSLLFPVNGITCTDPKKGARALRSYLETGDPKWAEVMES